MKRFRGGLVFKAQRLVYHSTLGWSVIKKKKKLSVKGVYRWRKTSLLKPSRLSSGFGSVGCQSRTLSLCTADAGGGRRAIGLARARERERERERERARERERERARERERDSDREIDTARASERERERERERESSPWFGATHWQVRLAPPRTISLQLEQFSSPGTPAKIRGGRAAICRQRGY